MYDLAIIGAGPAGATLARLIGHRYRILLVDRRPLDSPISLTDQTKCCGGLLAPDAQKSLAQLGLGVPQSVLIGPQLFVVRTIDLQQSVERFYQRHYLNLNRAAFDRWLVSLLPGQVDFRSGWSFKNFERSGNAFKIRFTRADQEYIESARVLIGADGAFSSLRRRAYSNLTWPRFYLAVQEWFQSPEPLPYFSALFDPRITDFYGWIIPKENSLIIGAALNPGAQALARFELLKQELSLWGFDLKRSLKKEGAWLARPLNTRQIVTGRDGVLLLGEAAGWISPSSAEGLSYAFNSAIQLSKSLLPDLTGFEARYARQTWGLRCRIQLKEWKRPFLYHRWLRYVVLRLGIKSISVTRGII